MQVLIANVGLSDLYFNIGTEEAPDFHNFRPGADEVGAVATALGCAEVGARYVAPEIAKLLAHDFAATMARLRYPILRPLLRHLSTSNTLDRVVLISTNQDVTRVRPDFAAGDTSDSAKILQHLIAHDFPALAEKICRQDFPADRDPFDLADAYDWFAGFLPQIAPPGEHTIIHIATSGGIPKLNDGLEQRAIYQYRERARLYQVSSRTSHRIPRPDAPDGEVHSHPPDANPLLRDQIRAAVRELLQRHDYGGARAVLDTFRAFQFWDTEVYAALRHAERRANYDFTGAAKSLKDIAAGQQGPFAAWYRQTNQPSPLQRLVDTASLATLYYQNGDFAEMLWRVAAFYENGLRLAAHLRFPHLDLLTGNRLATTKIKHDTALWDDLTHTAGFKQSPMQQYWDIDGELLRALCDCAFPKTELAAALNQYQENKHLRTAIALLQTLDGLRKPRNQLVHEFKGVSRASLNHFRPHSALKHSAGLAPGVENHAYLAPSLRAILNALADAAPEHERAAWQAACQSNPYEEIERYVRIALQC